MPRVYFALLAIRVQAELAVPGADPTRLAALAHLASNGRCQNASGNVGPCMPGREYCNKPFAHAPRFHLMDQHGCAENDPNGPVFDPVHGVIHHFYQIHLAAEPGGGPDYGHFVSKDFVHWAAMPVAIWNGFQVSPFKNTSYDNIAIFTGSGVIIDGAGPGGRGPGIVQIYPGLCSKKYWPKCRTGTLLAQAVPADYAGDELLTNWSKPSYNPIMEDTQRDPSTPWKLPTGEWRLRTYDSMYGSASDADLLAGKWYKIGESPDFRTCECPSFYPLPGPTPGFEAQYIAAGKARALPTHVHKTSCGGDWWQVGTYVAGPPMSTGNFSATPGWEDLYKQKKIDAGKFYASKDNEYPIKGRAGKRRINWGWAVVPPASTQTLPREITFNAATRSLEQAPLAELVDLRSPAALAKTDLAIEAGKVLDLGLQPGVAKQSEVVATFELPATNATFGVVLGKVDASDDNFTQRCVVDYTPPLADQAPFHEVVVQCNKVKDTLRLLPNEKHLNMRIFADATFLETYFQAGRVAMTVLLPLSDSSGVGLTSSAPVRASVSVYPMKSIWVSPEDVRKQPRVYDIAKPEVLDYV